MRDARMPARIRRRSSCMSVTGVGLEASTFLVCSPASTVPRKLEGYPALPKIQLKIPVSRGDKGRSWVDYRTSSSTAAQSRFTMAFVAYRTLPYCSGHRVG